MALVGSQVSSAVAPAPWTPYTGAFVAVTPIPTSAPQPTALPVPARSEGTPSPTPRMPEHVPVLPLMTSLSGNATWYCNADPRRAVLSPCMAVHPDGPGLDLYAAAGPGLRAWLGPNWRGMIVETCAANRPTQCVLVKLSDWCLCTGGPDRLIDLYYDAFAIVGGKVTIRR